MPEQGEQASGGSFIGRPLRNGEQVVLAHVANQDTTPRSAVNLELSLSDRQAGIAAGTLPETDTCRRAHRPGYLLVLAQVVWQGGRFAQDRNGGGFREVDGVDGDFRTGGCTLPPDVAAGVLATVRERYPTGSAIEVAWKPEGIAPGTWYRTAFLLPRLRLPRQ
jgi:hypothetical protein